MPLDTVILGKRACYALCVRLIPNVALLSDGVVPRPLLNRVGCIFVRHS